MGCDTYSEVGTVVLWYRPLHKFENGGGGGLVGGSIRVSEERPMYSGVEITVLKIVADHDPLGPLVVKGNFPPPRSNNLKI